MPVLTLDQIESLCADALKRAGASDEQAAIVAEEIMDAEAEGIRNVGLGYLHLYLRLSNQPASRGTPTYPSKRRSMRIPPMNRLGVSS